MHAVPKSFTHLLQLLTLPMASSIPSPSSTATVSKQLLLPKGLIFWKRISRYNISKAAKKQLASPGHSSFHSCGLALYQRQVSQGAPRFYVTLTLRGHFLFQIKDTCRLVLEAIRYACTSKEPMKN